MYLYLFNLYFLQIPGNQAFQILKNSVSGLKITIPSVQAGTGLQLALNGCYEGTYSGNPLDRFLYKPVYPLNRSNVLVPISALYNLKIPSKHPL